MTIALLAMAGVILYKETSSKPTPPQVPTQKTEKQANTNTKESTSMPSANQKKQYDSQPAMAIDQSKQYFATLKTSKGEIVVELNPAQTPLTVNNFVTLSRDGFYDDTIFHRTITGFMIQGGDPEGTGRGGPGYRFNDEPFEGEYTRGVIAMANAGPNTNGSQFFIMHQDYALPKNYVIFGHVVEGMEVVDAIATAPVKPSLNGESSAPVEPVVVTAVEIEEK